MPAPLVPRLIILLTALFLGLTSAACDQAGANGATAAVEPAPISVTVATAATQPVAGFMSVSGTLTAEDDADVAAEVSGRVVATPAERGQRVESGADLIHIAAAD